MLKVFSGARLFAAAAKVTFDNVLLITLLFSAVDYVRRRITVDRPVKRIIEATERIMQGDFSVRIRPLQGIPEDESFNRIVTAVNKMAEKPPLRVHSHAAESLPERRGTADPV